MFFEKNESLMSSGEFQCLGVKKLGRMFHIVAPVSRVRLSITHVVVRDIEGKDDGERKGREMGEERERRERRGGRWKRGEKDTRTHHCCSYKKVTRKKTVRPRNPHNKRRDVALE